MSVDFGNKERFKQIYTEYYSVLVNYAYSKTKDWELSREIVQQTFAKLWMRRKKTKISTSVKSYLFRMVHNSIIDYHRKNTRFTDLSDSPDMPDASSSRSGYSEEDLALLRHTIKRALESMKPKRRLIFELSKFEGLTYFEIANHLGISERTVEDNMAKALHQLKEKLARIKNENF